MSPEKLVHMANQIGKFFAHKGLDEGAAGVADHLQKFWDPRMREQLLTYAETSGEGLDEIVRVCLRRLKGESAEKAL